MFAWLFGRRKLKVSQSAIPKMILRDSWEACGGGFYVTQFRREIEQIAKSLCVPCHPCVHTRFNQEERCAELYSESGLIAQVNVEGEYGIPCRVIVASNLSSQGKTLFKNLFPGLLTEFKALPQATSQERSLR